MCIRDRYNPMQMKIDLKLNPRSTTSQHLHYLTSYVVLGVLFLQQTKLISIKQFSITNCGVAISWFTDLTLLHIFHASIQLSGQGIRNETAEVLIPRISLINTALRMLVLALCLRKQSAQKESNYHVYAWNLIPLLLFLAGEEGLIPVTIMVAVLVLHTARLRAEVRYQELKSLAYVATIACYFFYLTGHLAAVHSLQLGVGFVGLTDYNPILSGIFVAVNTLMSYIIVLLALPEIMRRSLAIALDSSLLVSQRSIVL
eukprot:TRINITY_DN6158_c0_g2_i2.p1 TRINITY_DN6158_c0_g2~~TRINITY_DN6158_c0_g2_i2.p1  ORF type:complete len:258 (-),score=41.41 TRINITY_DN6158_c0_g2_i2:163-936(-)